MPFVMGGGGGSVDLTEIEARLATLETAVPEGATGIAVSPTPPSGAAVSVWVDTSGGV